MKYRKWTALALAAALLLPAGAAQAEVVETSGYGMTRSDAESDALRSAVEKVMGVMVDAATLVSQSAVVEDEIYTHSRGFVTDYTVTAAGETGGRWQVAVRADVDTSPDSKLMEELTALRLIDTRLRNPRIAVYIPERHLLYGVPDAAGENAVIDALVSAGFTHVMAVSPRVSRLPYGWPRKAYAAWAASDMEHAARAVDADILIVGESFSEGLGDARKWLPGRQRTGMETSRARVEAKMYIAKTGQILAAEGKYGSGADISRAAAEKKAITAAGTALGESFRDRLMAMSQDSRTDIEVIVHASGAGEAAQVQRALSRVPGAGQAQLRSYEAGEAVFSVPYSGSPEGLFRALQGLSEVELVLEGISYNTLSLSVQ